MTFYSWMGEIIFLFKFHKYESLESLEYCILLDSNPLWTNL